MHLDGSVNPISGDYPFGDIKDNTGVGDGTIANRKMFADIFQTVGKIFADAGITPNNTPDNVSNGYQLYEALRGFVLYWAGAGAWSTDWTYTSPFGAHSTLPLKVRMQQIAIAGGGAPIFRVFIEGSVDSGMSYSGSADEAVLQLGTDIRPTKPILRTCAGGNNSGTGVCKVRIGTDGVLTVLAGSGSWNAQSGTDTIFFSFYYDLDY